MRALILMAEMLLRDYAKGQTVRIPDGISFSTCLSGSPSTSLACAIRLPAGPLAR